MPKFDKKKKKKEAIPLTCLILGGYLWKNNEYHTE